MSGDSVRNHQIFKKAHKLNYPLLADENGKVAKAFGVPYGSGGTIEREVDGETVKLTRGVTISRWTFVIDEDGKIAYKNEKVQAGKDSDKVLEVVKKLKKDKKDKSS